MPNPERTRRPADPPSLPPGPVLAICGWSGSGKTTVLRKVIPGLVERGLSVAVLKHDAHGIRVDPEGKDSDNLFRAGADVYLRGPGQSLVRARPGGGVHPERGSVGAVGTAGAAVAAGTAAAATAGEGGATDRDTRQKSDLPAVLRLLLEDHDVVLVEGHKGTPLPKVWISNEKEPEPPAGVTDVIEILPWNGERPNALSRILDDWLPRAWREPKIRAGILVGGASRRMGRPKQLLTLGGKTFLERTVDALSPHAEQVVLLGDGPVPEACAHLPRLPDPPGLGGPLAGILGAMRWGPGATWLMAGCDQPLVGADAIEWLLDQRAPGKWAVLPRLGAAGVEPLLAAYDARARVILESIAAGGHLAPSDLAAHPRTISPSPVGPIARSWRNVNTPEELEALRREVKAEA